MTGDSDMPSTSRTSHLPDPREALRREIRVGLDQLANGQYTIYDASTLPSLAAAIRSEERKQQSRQDSARDEDDPSPEGGAPDGA